MAGMVTLVIGRTATGPMAIIPGATMAVHFMGLMVMGGIIPIITAAGFRRQLHPLHRRLPSLRDSTNAHNAAGRVVQPTNSHNY